MRELSKKLLGILLAVIMAVVTISPAQGRAAENNDKGNENVIKTETPENKELAGNTSGVTQDDGSENVPSYDINMPVIESFDFEENGQTLKVSDTLHFTMSAYDSDSGIESVYVRIEYIGNVRGQGGSVWLEKSGDENLYTGELSCSELKGEQFYISEVRVDDKATNYVNLDTWDSEAGQHLYTFNLDCEVNIDNNVTVSNFRMQANPSNEDGKLRVGATVTYTADVSCNNEEINNCYGYLSTNTKSFSDWQHMEMSYQEDTHTLTGVFTVTEKTYPSEWYLSEIHIGTESKKDYYFYPSSIEPETNLKFEVVQEDFDTEPPIIESVTLDKNGQFVKAGDVVNLSVKVKEEHPDYAYAYFYPQVTNVSVSEHIALEYDVATGTYKGSITIAEDTYPCEWALMDLYIYDENRNRTSLHDFQKNYYETLPWYYKVKPGNTYREDVKKVTFEFYGYAEQEDGSYQPNSLIASKTVERCGRRATLKELGMSFPQPIAGVNAEWKYGYPWWYDEENSWIIDENTELLFNSTSDMTFTFTASYDKVCANVSFEYLTKDSGVKTAVIPQFVDNGTTYRDVLDALELPEDADEENFAGFELSYVDDFHNESSQVGADEKYPSWIQAKAKYKNCQVAWKVRYIGEDGKETSNVINKSYLEGTNVNDALAEVEPPENMEGMKFESWVLTDSNVGEISDPMTSLDAVAIYQGKTTVDAVYTYRGKDGTIVSGSGMVIMDGENLSDAEMEGAATDVFKEAIHYKGLILSEWTGTTDLNQPRYKTVTFQALYQNCVLTFHYPDGTSQYVVADKNKEFSLPTENEKYVEIVWRGYAKGETVNVTADKEFYVEDSKLRDNEEEKPQGVKLPEDEIERIKEKIENAETGSAITIDMKKATVVPKEVLEAIKGKSIDIVLDMGEYSWSIEGTDVLATQLRDIDLEVKIGTDVIPSNLVSSLAGDKPVTQISLTHNGNFGFRADLTLNLGKENSGGTGNLYYYDSDGKLIFMNSGKIGADGNTSLSFSHASDYAIVIDRADATDDNTKTDDNKIDDNKKDDNIKNNNNKNDVGKRETGGKADIKKNANSLTTDSGKGETQSSYRKSPKTGE